MASANDYFQYVGSNTATTLSSPGYTTGDASINVGSTTNWPTLSGITFAIDEIDSAGLRVSGSYNVFRGTVNTATQITNITYVGGDANRNYSAGATTRVYILVSYAQMNRLVDGLLVSHDQDGTLKAGAVDNAGVIADGIITNDEMATAVKPVTLMDETTFDFVASGCVWSGDAYGSTRAASMTAGVVYINGIRVTVSAVTARTFDASRDTYIDVGTDGVVDYNPQTNNAASPALAADHIRIGIIVTGASNIANVGSVNQGQEDKVLPIASSIPYAVTDSLGNLICNRNPNNTLIGYRQIVTNFTTTAVSTNTDVTGLSVPVIVPANRKIKTTIHIQEMGISGAAGFRVYNIIREGSTILNYASFVSPGAAYAQSPKAMHIHSPSAGLHTYKASVAQDVAGTLTVSATTASPAYISVELV